MNLSILNGLNSTVAPAVAAAPPPSTNYREMARAIAKKYGIDPDVFERQIQQESSFNPRARSGAGAMGLGQLMPDTARGLGVRDPWDPEQNLDGAARYMVQQLKRFGGNYRLALAAYNAGPGNVRKYGNKVPPFKETQNYVAKIYDQHRTPAKTSPGSHSASTKVPEPTTGPPAPAAPAEPVAPPQIVVPQMDPFSIGDNPNAGLEQQMAQLQQEHDDATAELQRRRAGLNENRQKIVDLESQPLPTAPVMPEGGGYSSRDAGNNLLGGALLALAGVDAKGIQAATGGYHDAKVGKAEQQYAQQAQEYNQTVGQRDRDIKALETRDRYESDDINDLQGLRDRLSMKLPDLSIKIGDQKSKDLNKLLTVATDPKRSKGDRMAAYAVMRSRGYLEQFTPQDQDLLAKGVNQDGAAVVQAQKNYNLAVSKAEVDKAYKNWRKDLDERKFKESVRSTNARLGQTWAMHKERIQTSWAQLNQREDWDAQQKSYAVLTEHYSAATKEFADMESKVRTQKASVVAGRQSIRDQMTAIGRMDKGSSEERKARKQVDEDRVKIEKAESEMKALESALGKAKAELDDLKPPPLVHQPAGGGK